MRVWEHRGVSTCSGTCTEGAGRDGEQRLERAFANLTALRGAALRQLDKSGTFYKKRRSQDRPRLSFGHYTKLPTAFIEHDAYCVKH